MNRPKIAEDSMRKWFKIVFAVNFETSMDQFSSNNLSNFKDRSIKKLEKEEYTGFEQ